MLYKEKHFSPPVRLLQMSRDSIHQRVANIQMPWRVGGVAAYSSGRALETSWPHILYGFRVHPGDQWLADRPTDRQADPEAARS